MQRAAWMFRLKPGREEEYRRAHTQVWSELIEAARAAGLRNHGVFVRGDIVFAYAESEDMQATMSRLATDAVNLRWNEAMSSLMEDVDGVALEDVFHFD